MAVEGTDSVHDLDYCYYSLSGRHVVVAVDVVRRVDEDDHPPFVSPVQDWLLVMVR